MCHLNQTFLTWDSDQSIVSVLKTLTDLSWPANTFHYIHPADEARFRQANEEMPPDVKNGFGMAPSSTVVTWCLNPNHIWNPASLSWRSQIPSAGASPHEFVTLEESGNAGSELMECVYVSLAVPEHTQRFFTQAQAGMQHGMCLIHNMHAVGTQYTIYRKVTHKKPSEMTIFMSHTQTAWLTLGLKSDITPDPWLTETSTRT